MFLMHWEVIDVIKKLGMMKEYLIFLKKREANILTQNLLISFFEHLDEFLEIRDSLKDNF